MMRSPISVWRSMKRHSPASSGPGLSRISSGIATLPTSCSSAAIRTWSTSPVGEAERARDLLGELRRRRRRGGSARGRARRGSAASPPWSRGASCGRPPRLCSYRRWSAIRSASLGSAASAGSSTVAVRAADGEALAGLVQRDRAGGDRQVVGRCRAARRTRRRPSGRRARGRRRRAPGARRAAAAARRRTGGRSCRCSA